MSPILPPKLLASHPRVTAAFVLSLVLHAALLAGWRPAAMAPARTSGFETIEVSLMGAPALSFAAPAAPARRPVAAAPPAPGEQPVAAETAREPGDGAPADVPLVEAANGPSLARGPQLDPIVEARSDVSSLNNPKPDYPIAARRRGLQGRVVLAAHVDADGGCLEVRLKHSSGYDLLDRAALDSVRRWRFIPAHRGQQPVASWVDVPVRFRLDS